MFVGEIPSKYYYVNVYDWKYKKETVDNVAKIVKFLAEENIPHNVLFMFPARSCSDEVYTYLFPRSKASTAKEYTNLNIACCELAGFFTLAVSVLKSKRRGHILYHS